MDLNRTCQKLYIERQFGSSGGDENWQIIPVGPPF